MMEIEGWRLSLPDNGFRPGGEVGPESVHGLMQRQLAVLVHYLHANILLVISLASLRRLSRSSDPSIRAQRQAPATTVLETSRRILEMTTLIDVEPYTTVWSVALLFDRT
jgi:hypothetical protein